MNGSARKNAFKVFRFTWATRSPNTHKRGSDGGRLRMPQALMGQGDWGKVKGGDAYVSLFELMFLFAVISVIGVVDSAFSADTVRLRFELRPSQYVKSPNNFAFYDSNLFLS